MDARNLKQEIANAVGAHGLWKARILEAIDKGTSDWTPEQVYPNNNCAFGKWLEGFVPLEKEDHYKKVYALHTDFHKEASRVLGLALAGKKEEAGKAVENGTTYGELTRNLTMAMMAWQKTQA
ncbi:MAG: hypothetical protein A2600_13640 [Candidatus Lambdaproteobacteria bacterium RIFOXYD1_FULL_56_27]|uniref:Chemoreceptor zinc-binding domain-containing protein n=1 Tax=Candidatus Lambdaproteobacteria bacterium RIFOXYD2_FULL_56_26 TaxID=1817773 RepID=A0A1F6GTS1_9PROT|nr:MAG: hypothetical protein A2426_02235 [Candidatus Lambdaproteobacteria bacterium RIFOXYC1_FULL_56_13]OGH01543.1 MAG: hypothetical protein A2557_14015 [Candidatus Lambdaproteobacteria bacterium RIFOXYD2_FULL_56_26]OGH06764.1 MAG: hypothetical protein A2600_13640 [Candidatus Lambdaproteobacteria bacterium RIFOXYD1_FULL_56_27]